MVHFKDKIGKDYPKKSKSLVSAKAVALIGMSSTRLEPACAVIQNVVSIIAEQRSLRSCCFLQKRYGAAQAAVCKNRHISLDTMYVLSTHQGNYILLCCGCFERKKENNCSKFFFSFFDATL